MKAPADSFRLMDDDDESNAKAEDEEEEDNYDDDYEDDDYEKLEEEKKAAKKAAPIFNAYQDQSDAGFHATSTETMNKKNDALVDQEAILTRKKTN